MPWPLLFSHKQNLEQLDTTSSTTDIESGEDENQFHQSPIQEQRVCNQYLVFK